MIHDKSLSNSIATPVIVMADDPLPSYANDDFDDVFGSAPSSPSLLPSQHPSTGNLEPSDIPRLREKHETEGYRDGVTKGKGESVQAGFDEGYGLGAVLGLKIGKISGLLEGILAGLRGEGLGMEGERTRMEGLVKGAKEELSTTSVFGREYWGEDGIWKFEVGKEGDGEGEVVFPDVAAAHPLVRKWEGVVEEEVKRWGLDLGIFDGDVDGEGDEEEVVAVKGAQGKEVRRGEVESEPVAAGMAKVLGISKKDLSW
ncbi:Essential protein Yae1, N terminal [Cadophora gregata]|uniref:Essential protein Yae1, N terminal n=1 Tax=Cadophora gregata TaxID=51156 RepID=UPI0026DAB509|nr:Essential protein Yae1, N terminal [Cadophora gregata]KAK0111653.1 Essential protein Yae1, N terminal [Cadophora gregata]